MAEVDETVDEEEVEDEDAAEAEDAEAGVKEGTSIDPVTDEPQQVDDAGQVIPVEVDQEGNPVEDSELGDRVGQEDDEEEEE